MALSIPDFWKLVVQSRLLSPAECQQAGAGFAAQMPGTADAAPLVDWLVKQRTITPFHAKVLLAGRPGPFIFGEYKVWDRVEKGRLAGLFRAAHQPTRQAVGLQFLSGDLTKDRDALSRFAARIAAAGKLRHSLLWSCYQLVDLGSYKFVAVAQVAGQSLDEILATKKPLPPVEACRVARFAAQALAELHKAGLPHGDIRPANIWLDTSGNVKLLHAPFVPEPQPRSKWPANRLASVADYAAPELWRDDRPADAAADVYSLGCTLYKLLCGRPPFADGDAAQKQQRHLEAAPAPLDKVNNSVPRALAQVVEHMLAKDPAKRYQQASQIIDALTPYVPPAKAAIPQEPATAESQAYEQSLRQPRAAAAAAAPAMAQPVAAGMPRATPVAAVPSAAFAGTPVAVAVPAARGNGHAMPVAQPVALAGQAMPLAQPRMSAPVAAAVMPGPQVAQAVPLGASPVMAVAAPMAAAAVSPTLEFAMETAETPASVGISTTRRLSAKRKRSNQMLMLSSLVVLVIGGVAVAALWPKLFGGSKAIPEGQAPDGTPVAAATNTSQKPVGEANPDKPKKKKKKKDGDGESGSAATTPPPDANAEKLLTLDEPMWSPPTKGPPLTLAYFPSGVQAYVALRPADIWKHSEGAKVLDALGPLGELAKTELQTMSGLPPEGIELAVFGLLETGPNSPPSIALVVHAARSIDLEEILSEWKNPAEESVGGFKVYRGQQQTYYLPAEGKEKVLVVCPFKESDTEAVKEWLDGTKGSPVLLPQFELLRRSSDADRLLTVLFMPDFFIKGGGKTLFAGPVERMIEPLKSFLLETDGAHYPRAAMFSAHLTSDDFFLEFRAHGTASEEPLLLAKSYRDRVGAFGNAFEDYSVRLNPQDYGKKLLLRFPRMLEQLGTHTVAAADDKQAIVRCYLPAVAASNLALATQLAVLEVPGAAGAAPAAVAGGGGAKTVADKLKGKITLSFPRNTLEKCMELFGEEIGAPVEIIGGDLQLEGITKNQSFGLDEKDKPAVDILKKVMIQANPAGKLVYVIKEKDGKETLFITTRAGAKKRGDKLTPDQEEEKK